MLFILAIISWLTVAVAAVVVGFKVWRRPIQADRRRLLVRVGLWGFGLWFLLSLILLLLGSTRLGPIAWFLLHPVAIPSSIGIFTKLALWGWSFTPLPWQGVLANVTGCLMTSALFWTPLLALRSHRVSVRSGAGLQVLFLILALLAGLLVQAWHTPGGIVI